MTTYWKKENGVSTSESKQSGQVSDQHPGVVWRGYTYPLGGENGQYMASTGVQLIADSIRQILLTPIGSRVMRRSFGSNLLNLIDDNITAFRLNRLKTEIKNSLAQWEPRAIIQNIIIEESDTVVTINIYFEYSQESYYSTLELPKQGNEQ